MTQDAAETAATQASGFTDGPDSTLPFDNGDSGTAPDAGSAGTAGLQGRTGTQAFDRDTEVFARFLLGNDEAFRVLYDLHERPLYLYILRLVGSAGDAQDIFQDVWIRMFRLLWRADSGYEVFGLAL